MSVMYSKKKKNKKKKNKKKKTKKKKNKNKKKNDLQYWLLNLHYQIILL